MRISCFDLLDARVVGGHADDEALRAGPVGWTYARLLEDVAAFGGVLRHCGVAPGDPVGVALPDCAEAVIAVLAVARVGAEPALGVVPDHGTVLVTASTEVDALTAATSGVVLVKQRPDDPWPLRDGLDHDWDVVMRAGRTDPAPCAEGAALAVDDPRVRGWVDTLRGGGTVRVAG